MNNRTVYYLFFLQVITPYIINTAPDDLGKTHFIVGAPITPAKITRDHHQSNKQKHVCCAYFAPDDNLQKLIISYIDQEKEQIDIAIYSFTNKHIADALIKAYNRGVTIRIVTDPSWLNDQFSKIHMLQKHGVPIYLYNAHHNKKGGNSRNLMHNKFMIFRKNKEGKSYIWTGSYNFTRAATMSNQENVVIISKYSVVKQYQSQFERLIARCKQLAI